MSGEYRVTVKVSNNLIREAMERCGYVGRGSVSRFMRDNDMTTGDVYQLLGLKAAPLLKSGEFSAAAKRLMEALGAAPSDLWTDEQLVMALPTNEGAFDCDAASLAAVTGGTFERIESDPEAMAEQSSVRQAVERLLTSVPTREAKVLRLRNGIGCDEMTLEETGELMGVTRERVRQIEAKAIRHLRHPSRSRLVDGRPMLSNVVERCEGAKDDDRWRLEICVDCRRRTEVLHDVEYTFIKRPPAVKRGDGYECDKRIAEIE